MNDQAMTMIQGRIIKLTEQRDVLNAEAQQTEQAIQVALDRVKKLRQVIAETDHEIQQWKAALPVDEAPIVISDQPVKSRRRKAAKA